MKKNQFEPYYMGSGHWAIYDKKEHMIIQQTLPCYPTKKAALEECRRLKQKGLV